MKNIVVLYKNEEDQIICRQLSEKGVAEAKEGGTAGEEYWDEGGAILLDELEEILDKEI